MVVDIHTGKILLAALGPTDSAAPSAPAVLVAGAGLAVAPPPVRTGSDIVRAVEGVWAAIRGEHPEVPATAVSVGPITGADNARRPKNIAFFAARRWRHVRTSLPSDELFIASEALATGGAGVMEIVLHEATHGIASTRLAQAVRNGEDPRKYRETSPKGYHNRIFRQIAEEVGLTCGPCNSSNGYADTELAPGTAERWGTQIKLLDKAITAYRIEDIPPEKKRKKKGRPKVEGRCGCTPPHVVTFTPEEAASQQGLLMCRGSLSPYEFAFPDSDGDCNE
ncbi:hypothetical protein [Streptomyces hydrogenans]|uniref:hypothetical protein n=1 Tax=Streptomyces hydrogenans TaxID=1873719 RepID=UPI00380B9720